MAQAKSGDTVKVHYTGTLDDGTVFDSSVGSDPLEFTIGQGMVIPGFETAVTDMEVGASTNVTIPVDEAYGEYRDDLALKIEKNQIPEHITPEVGLQLQVNGEGGQVIPVMVTEVADDTVTLDANHPLAGKSLTFEIQLVEIVG